MNVFILSWSYQKSKPLHTGLNIVLLGLGIAVITIILLLNDQLEKKIEDNSRGIDLVVGAKGSPLQLILCNIFHIDFPTGNIKLQEAEKLAGNRLVKWAIPMALGDSYMGYRIVGSTKNYVDHYGGELAEGFWWQNDLEVCVGAAVAERLQLQVGSSFHSMHGLTLESSEHEGHGYVVKGILKRSNTVLDQLILTNVQSIWQVHDHDSARQVDGPASRLIPGLHSGDSTKEITSLLIKYQNPIAAIQLPRFINTQTPLQAASPAFETARLFSILGIGAELMMGFAYVIIIISALSIFIALYNSLKERKYDLAIMRSMGASKTSLVTTVLLEGLSLTFFGTVFGLVLGHIALLLFTVFVADAKQMELTSSVFIAEEWLILAASLLLGLLCSVLPSWQAYRTDIHKILAGNG
ncbi:MAG: FtsX-like permease family protein [Flammeovirgaceae bacterium]|nr:FtsX-like permease family protein [Flammeovirgaceae bacterium]